MSVQFAEAPDEAGEIAARWLDTFGAALQAQNAAAVAATARNTIRSMVLRLPRAAQGSLAARLPIFAGSQNC